MTFLNSISWSPYKTVYCSSGENILQAPTFLSPYSSLRQEQKLLKAHSSNDLPINMLYQKELHPIRTPGFMDIRFAQVLPNPIGQGKTFLQTFSVVTWVRDSWGLALLVKSEAKALSMSALSSAPAAGCPSHSVAGIHFPFCYWCTWRNPSYTPWHPWPGLIPVWPWLPHGLSAHSDHILTFIPASTSCVYPAHDCFDRGSLFIHAGVLLLLPHFSLIGMHHF